MLELNRVRPRGGCEAGSAVVTGAGQLPAKWVIHAVGPIWRGGGFGESEVLASAYGTSLRLQRRKKGAAVVSFPSLSTGAFGYPLGHGRARRPGGGGSLLARRRRQPATRGPLRAL